MSVQTMKAERFGNVNPQDRKAFALDPSAEP